MNQSKTQNIKFEVGTRTVVNRSRYWPTLMQFEGNSSGGMINTQFNSFSVIAGTFQSHFHPKSKLFHLTSSDGSRGTFVLILAVRQQSTSRVWHMALYSPSKGKLLAHRRVSQLLCWRLHQKYINFTQLECRSVYRFVLVCAASNRGLPEERSLHEL